MKIYNTNISPPRHCPSAPTNPWGGWCCPWGTPASRRFWPSDSIASTSRCLRPCWTAALPQLRSHWNAVPDEQVHPYLPVLHGEHVRWRRHVILHVQQGSSSSSVPCPRSSGTTASLPLAWAAKLHTLQTQTHPSGWVATLHWF